MGGRRGLQPDGQALLSFDPLIGDTDVRSIRRSETCTELASFRESMMVASISGGAEKLKAMNGVVVKALKPPIEEKALCKSLPLYIARRYGITSQYSYHKRLTTFGYNGLHPLKSYYQHFKETDSVRGMSVDPD